MKLGLPEQRVLAYLKKAGADRGWIAGNVTSIARSLNRVHTGVGRALANLEQRKLIQRRGLPTNEIRIVPTDGAS